MSGIACRPLDRDIGHPHPQTAVVGRHIEDAGPGPPAQVISHPRGDQDKFEHGKRAESQGDAETVLTAADAYIVREEKQEQDSIQALHSLLELILCRLSNEVQDGIQVNYADEVIRISYFRVAA